MAVTSSIQPTINPNRFDRLTRHPQFLLAYTPHSLVNTSSIDTPPIPMRGAHSQMRAIICHFKKSSRPNTPTMMPSTCNQQRVDPPIQSGRRQGLPRDRGTRAFLGIDAHQVHEVQDMQRVLRAADLAGHVAQHGVGANRTPHPHSRTPQRTRRL